MRYRTLLFQLLIMEVLHIILVEMCVCISVHTFMCILGTGIATGYIAQDIQLSLKY